jgi:hypothetical protein
VIGGVEINNNKFISEFHGDNFGFLHIFTERIKVDFSVSTDLCHGRTQISHRTLKIRRDLNTFSHQGESCNSDSADG